MEHVHALAEVHITALAVGLHLTTDDPLLVKTRAGARAQRVLSGKRRVVLGRVKGANVVVLSLASTRSLALGVEVVGGLVEHLHSLTLEASLATSTSPAEAGDAARVRVILVEALSGEDSDLLLLSGKERLGELDSIEEGSRELENVDLVLSETKLEARQGIDLLQVFLDALRDGDEGLLRSGILLLREGDVETMDDITLSVSKVSTKPHLAGLDVVGRVVEANVGLVGSLHGTREQKGRHVVLGHRLQPLTLEPREVLPL